VFPETKRIEVGGTLGLPKAFPKALRAENKKPVL